MLSLPLSPSNLLFGHHSKKFLVGRERLELPEALATWFTVKTATNYGLSTQILNKYVEGGQHCQCQNIDNVYIKDEPLSTYMAKGWGVDPHAIPGTTCFQDKAHRRVS